MVGRVTMKDVAQVAGVSQAAVSYAYGRPHKLSPEQCERILAIAADIGYPGPSAIGASLRSGRTGAVGVMVMDSLSYAFTDPSTQALLRGIADDAHLGTTDLTIIPLSRSGRFLNSPQDGTRGLVDGIIVHSLPDDHPALRALAARGVPLVVVDAPILPAVPRVSVDDRAAAYELMTHVVALGHRRIGVLADRLLPDGHRGAVDAHRLERATERVVRERLLGYLRATDEARIGRGSVPIIEAGGFDTASGHAAAQALLHEHEVTAIVATSDCLALASLDVLESRGVGVPERVAVAGFDDAPEAALRGLTTVRQPLVTKGRIAASMLHRLLAGESEVADVVVPTELVLRTSTAAPPLPHQTSRESETS